MDSMKAILKDMTLSLICVIEITGVALQDGLHDFTRRMCGGLNEEMKVVVHKTISVKFKLIFMMGFCENKKKSIFIYIV